VRELQLLPIRAQPLASIYFGGGTPSLLQPEQFDGLLKEIGIRIPIRTDAEITLEVNPGSVNLRSLNAFHEIGINRISMGIQSFDNHFLDSLGRIHTGDQARHTFHAARTAGFENISVDLIHSLPSQSIDQWHSELQHAIALAPEHISIYGLTIEEGTPFAQDYPSTSEELADEDLSADMFEHADALLTQAGYEHYEIANYARPGYHSQHNSGYWRRDGYRGLGVAAHSLVREGHGVRFSNPDTLEAYRRMLTSGELVRVDEQVLTEKEAMAEYMFLGLRLAEGVDRHLFMREFGRSLESVYGSAIAALAQLGLLITNDDAVTLTGRGMLLSNQVFVKFLE
jgi:oxygen-independent coproporphyrinogen-3 oxidase